tara:strand:- start:1521 stop:1808 length:288 start_codon:yes stop_codon:yes gene_type:complete
LNESGKDCTVIEYLKEIPTEDELKVIFNTLKINPSDGIRKNEAEFKENNLNQYINDKDKMIKSMVKFPKIIERPIVVTPKGAVIARPPERVFEIL